MLDWPVRTGSGAEIAPPTAPFAEDQATPSGAARPRGLGLAGRVLVITIGFVLLAMALFYVTRIAAFRETWLHNKLASAETVVHAFDAGGTNEVPPELARKILASVEVKSIAIPSPSGTRLLETSRRAARRGPDRRPRQRDIPRQRRPSLRRALRQTGNGHSGVERIFASTRPASQSLWTKRRLSPRYGGCRTRCSTSPS